MTYREARAKILTEGKHAEDRQNLLVEKVIRPVSIYLTLPLIDRGIAPTTVTKVSLAFSTRRFCRSSACFPSVRIFALASR